MFDKLLESKQKGVIKYDLSIEQKSEAFPFLLKHGDEYLKFRLYLNHNDPKFAYPYGPVADTFTLYSFAVKQTINYFIPNKQNESEFLWDFYTLLKVFEVKLEQLNLDPLVINLNVSAETFLNKNYFTNTKKLFFNFRANQDYNRSLIKVNLLQQQFYANNEKIKKCLPPQIKRLVIISSTDSNKDINDLDEVVEFKNLLVYDSSKTLEEIYVEKPWFHDNETYKIV